MGCIAMKIFCILLNKLALLFGLRLFWFGFFFFPLPDFAKKYLNSVLPLLADIVYSKFCVPGALSE